MCWLILFPPTFWLKVIKVSERFNDFNHDLPFVVVDGGAEFASRLRQQSFCCLAQPACAGWFAPLLRRVVVGWCWDSSNCPNTVHSLSGWGCALLFAAHIPFATSCSSRYLFGGLS